jgi:hypothetical protein
LCGVIRIQAVAFGGSAGNALRVFEDAVVIAIFPGILQLSFHVAAANFHRIQFVSADAPRQNLQSAARRIELPFAVDANHRHRERPVLFAHRKDHTVGVCRILLDLQFLVSGTGELSAQFFILHRIAGFENVLTVGSE